MTAPAPTGDLCKEAYHAGAQQALCALGLVPSMEKEAFLGALKAVGKHALKPLWEGAKNTYKGIADVAAKPFEHAGRGIMSAAPKSWQPTVGAIGKGVPAQMAGFGLFGGALEGSNALGAATGSGELGWDWNRAAKGFGSGAAMGAGWGLGSNAFRTGVKGVANKMGRGAALERAAAPGWFGGFSSGVRGKTTVNVAKAGPVRPGTFFKAPRTPGTYAETVTKSGPVMPAPQLAARRLSKGFKGLGSNALLGGGGFIAGDLATGGGLSGAVYDIAKGQKPPRPVYAYPQTYAPFMARAATSRLGRVGLMPYHQGYRPQRSY